MTEQKMITPPSTFQLLTEVRALLELGTYVPALPLLHQLPRGDGHPVLVYPCFLATNRATAPLRRFLKDRGYQPFGWKLGRNQGYSPAMDARMQERVWRLHKRFGRKISLIGWSLGGVYAREIARAVPDAVRQVITLGSPFAHAQKASNLGWLYNLISGERLEAVDSRLLARMMEPPPVPSTAIFSRADGVVAWNCSMEQKGAPLADNVEVKGSHCGLGHNPLALYVIGDRLAQPEDDWQPFDRRGLRKAFFPDPYREAKERKAPQKSDWGKRIEALDQALARLNAATLPN